MLKLKEWKPKLIEITNENNEFLRKAFEKTFLRKLERKPNGFGMSSSGFCLDKLKLEKIHADSIIPDCNGSMVTGVIYHDRLPSIVKNHPYGKAHLPKNKWNPIQWYKAWKNRPRYETIVQYYSGEGWITEGHCDCDIPAMNTIIEYKTTSMPGEKSVDDEIINAYILQANAYAKVKGRKYWELWINYIKFSSVYDNFCTVIRGTTSNDIFDEFKERISWVWSAIQNNTSLSGPEMDWECRNCMVKTKCKKLQDKYKDILAFLPCIRSVFIDKSSEALFKTFYAKKWIKYDANTKKYSITEKFEKENGLK